MAEESEEKLEVVVEPDKIAGQTAETAGEKEESPVVEIVDDTPEEDKKHKRRPDGQEPDLPEDEEIAKYSESVQKRIKKLKYEFHEERRAKEEAQRQLDEAARIAKMAISSHEEMRKRYSQGEQVLVTEAKNRNEAELARAKELYKKAFESGDPDKLAESQVIIARLAAEQRDISAYRVTEPPQIEMPKPKQAPKPSQEAESWAKENEWFGKDHDMTNYALVLDERIKRQGVVPDSPEYYTALNAGLRREFPQRFKVEPDSSSTRDVSPPKKPGNVVAPTSRTQANSPRTITLTKSQADLARRLGISPEGYAKQLLKLEGNK